MKDSQWILVYVFIKHFYLVFYYFQVWDILSFKRIYYIHQINYHRVNIMVSCSFFVSRLLYLTVITAYSKLIQIPKGKYTKYP